MLSAPGKERCLFEKQPFYRFSVPEVAAQRGDVVSFSDCWSFGPDDQGRGAAVASSAVRGDMEMLKDIFESNDCTIFISPVWAWRRLICRMFSNTGLFVSM